MAVLAQTPELDAILVRRFQQGDRYAFDRIVEIYYPQVGQTVSRMFSDPERVNDVTQEVFFRLYKALPKLKAGVTLVAYIYRIVDFAVKDEISRKQKEARVLSFSDLDDSEGERDSTIDRIASTDTPETALEQREQQRTVQEVIREIPPPFQMPYILFELQQLSLQEIAAHLQVPMGTVKSRLSRAREYFEKKILEKRELFCS